MTTQQTQQFMSPYQSQVIDATLAEFDVINKYKNNSIRDQQAASGALGRWSSRSADSQSLEQASERRALLQAGLLQQGFGQATS